MTKSRKDILLEFGGPYGAMFFTAFLPFVVYALNVFVEDPSCVSNIVSCPAVLRSLPSSATLHNLLLSCAIYIGWCLFQVVLERLVPGYWKEGVKQQQAPLLYKINGHSCFWVSVICVVLSSTILPLHHVTNLILPLAIISILFTTILAVILYVAALRPGVTVAASVSGIPFHDFFLGRELNPRIGSFDVKYFCELRPGLIGWAVLNLCMLLKQFHEGNVSPSMVLVNIFQGLYVWDALFFEPSVLTTMDITSDGFGFMLAFGDLAWVPFTYCLQAHFLVANDPGLSVFVLAPISALNFLGYWIFRGANLQKDMFRKDPSIAQKKGWKTLKTESGRELLLSGWWGMARKINYLGDWLQSVAWCLLCGFQSPLPYFYCIYFFVLLMHRALRDDHACSTKYKADWVKYKQQVPYLFIPYVF